MDDFERRKKELLGPIFFEAGAGLHDSQLFEYTVAYLLYLLSRLGVTELEVHQASAILDDDEKKTAGQLVSLLRKQVAVGDELEQILKDALVARNHLIHRFLVENIERVLDPGGIEELRVEIAALRRRVRLVQKTLDPIIKSLALLADGLSIDDVAKQARERLGSHRPN